MTAFVRNNRVSQSNRQTSRLPATVFGEMFFRGSLLENGFGLGWLMQNDKKIWVKKDWFLARNPVAANPNADGHQGSVRYQVLNYIVAVLLVLAALGISQGIRPWLDGSALFILFVVASLIAAWKSGLGPGIAALVLGLFAADFFFVEPLYQLGPSTPKELILMLINACAAGVGLAAIVNLHRARFRERQIQVLATKLEHEIGQHRKALADLRVAKEQLDDHARLLENRVAERTANLVETVKSLENVLYHIAHDFRAPLRALSGFTQLLKDSLDSRFAGEEPYYMDRIITGAQRMDRLIMDLLAYGRLGHVHLNLTQTDTQKLVLHAEQQLDSQIKEKQAVVDVIAPMPVVQADETLLEGAVAELLKNALNFTPRGVHPRVRIWAESLGTRARVWVEDNGIGIEPEYQDRIFRVFERLYPQPDQRSTGIGLAVVAKTMERLGGSAGVKSEPGKGSKFWFEVPLAKEAQ